MKKLPLYVSLLVASAWATPSEAQFLFRKPRGATVAPANTANTANTGSAANSANAASQRIAELIGAAQTDAEERKRAQAVGALRNFDGNTHPEVPAVLADVARSDKSAAVRQQAIESLAALRPTSQLAGQTLEWSAAQDPSWRVRWEAKTALLRYNLAGYSKTTPQGAPASQPSTQEPPLMDSPPGPRGYGAPPSRPPSVQLPPRVETPPSRAMSEANPAGPAPAPQPSGGSFLSRILPGRKTAPAAAPSAPTFNQPLPGAATSPPPLLETPPPIVIEGPPSAKAQFAAPLPNLAQGKNTPPPSTKGGEVTEPVFRPAGQPAPRPGPGFTTAEPQRRNTIPPAQVEEIPLLIPPM